MDRSFGIAAGRRLSVALLMFLSVSVPAGSRAVWDVSAGPSRLSGTGRIPGSPVSLRPTDGNADPRGHGYSVPSQHVCGPHVCVHWVNTTSDAPPLADANRNGVPDQVDRTLDAFETAWRVEVTRMGFRAPMSDGSSADHGPNDLLDVYLADVGASGLAGYVATDDPHANDDAYPYRNYSAYIVVDDDFSTAQLGSSGGPGGLRATAAHEFFHAVQYAYDSGEDPWLTEGTAVWMEDAVADDVDANRRWLGSSALEHPWDPVDSSRGLNEYGAWIFWRFLTESRGGRDGGATLIRRVWELAADGPGDPDLFSAQALQQVLGSSGRSLAGALATFGAWNLAPAAFYQEGAAFPQASISGLLRIERPTARDGLVDAVAQPSDDELGLVRARIDGQRILAALPRRTAGRDGCGAGRDLPAIGNHPPGAVDARRGR